MFKIVTLYKTKKYNGMTHSFGKNLSLNSENLEELQN